MATGTATLNNGLPGGTLTGALQTPPLTNPVSRHITTVVVWTVLTGTEYDVHMVSGVTTVDASSITTHDLDAVVTNPVGSTMTLISADMSYTVSGGGSLAIPGEFGRVPDQAARGL